MTKKPKLDIAQSGNGPVLKHNPFGALASANAPERVTESETPAAVSPPVKKPARARLLLRREKKHRGGKTVIIISGFSSRPELGADTIAELAKHMKHELGCGGTVEDSEIIVQGDQPARVAEVLRARGFDVGGVTS